MMALPGCLAVCTNSPQLGLCILKYLGKSPTRAKTTPSLKTLPFMYFSFNSKLQILHTIKDIQKPYLILNYPFPLWIFCYGRWFSLLHHFHSSHEWCLRAVCDYWSQLIPLVLPLPGQTLPCLVPHSNLKIINSMIELNLKLVARWNRYLKKKYWCCYYVNILE